MHRVLDVQTDRAGRQQSLHQLRRRQAVAGLDVGRYRHVDCRGDPADRVERLIRRHPSLSLAPNDSATGWLPMVRAAKPASTANLADHTSQTVGNTTGRLPCRDLRVSARSANTEWSGVAVTVGSSVGRMADTNDL